MSTEPRDMPYAEAETPASSRARDVDAAPTETLVSGAVGDRCVNCGAPLASDQRYCVVCGERRGAARFSLPPTADATTVKETRVTTARGPRRPRFNSGTTLVAGVATLLLAVLVGVVIGRGAAGTTKTVTSGAGNVHVTVGGASSTPAASASTPGSGSSSGASSSKSFGGKGGKGGKGAKHTGGGSKSPPASKKTAQQESSAAAKVTGGSGAPPATVTVGQKGSGKGYNKKTHKFDGSFFGQ